MIDGLGGEEVNQTVNIQTAYISGTDVLGTTGSFAGADITTLVGTTATFTTFNGNLSGTSAVVNAENFEDQDGEILSLGVGSGTTNWGATITAGSATLGTGSNLWVEYTTEFSGKPVVVTTNYTSPGENVGVIVGSITLGSFYVEGETASDEFGWMAMGLPD